MKSALPKEYLELAKLRATTRWANYSQPEDYGYDFTSWVSPYTKGAHTFGTVAIVLQDWSGSDTMKGLPDEEVQKFGRTINLKTNIRLEELLRRIMGKKIQDIYATNIFPFVKKGGISSYIPFSDIKKSASMFTKIELEIAHPKIVLALGNNAFYGLQSAGVSCIHLPHPAARIGSIEKHEKIWREKLNLIV